MAGGVGLKTLHCILWRSFFQLFYICITPCGYSGRRTPRGCWFPRWKIKLTLVHLLARDLSVLRPASVDEQLSTKVRGIATVGTIFENLPSDWPKAAHLPNRSQSRPPVQFPSQPPLSNHSPMCPQIQDVSWSPLVPTLLIGSHKLHLPSAQYILP